MNTETPFLGKRGGILWFLGWLIGVLIWFSYPHISKSDGGKVSTIGVGMTMLGDLAEIGSGWSERSITPDI